MNKMENGSETNTSVQVKEKPADESKTGEVETEETIPDKIKAEQNVKKEEPSEKISQTIQNEEPSKEVAETINNEKPREESSETIKEEEPSEELLEKIRTQIEFYFGDINLQRDKFLIEQTKLDQGWIPLTVMLNFKLLASMSKDTKVIIKALETSELMEVSEDRKKIRRSPAHPLPVFNEAYRKAQAEKTVYMKGFPRNDMYIQKLKEFFKAYEPFDNIIMRKFQDKDKKLQFKGSIFVQFKTLDDAKAFMARESVKYGDTELIRKFSEDYSMEKAKEAEERKQKRSLQKDQAGSNKSKPTKVEDDETETETKQTGKLEFNKGAILHFTGASDETTREMIKERLIEIGGEVAWMDFQKNEVEGWVRLQDANTGKALVEKMNDGKLEINNTEVSFRALEGDEEAKYIEVAQMMRDMRYKNKRQPRRNRGRKVGRNIPQKGKKRRGSPVHGEGGAKKHARE